MRPKVSDKFDYEGEIVLVIGKEGRHIPQDKALSHIGGLTLGNEGSVRDWLRHGTLNVTQGKNFDASGSLGPWIVPADDLDPGKPLRVTTKVNGELRQDDTTDRLTWGFAWLINYISTFATLKPGDLIWTGTPTGAGGHQNPPQWLKPGDVVEVEVPEHRRAAEQGGGRELMPPLRLRVVIRDPEGDDLDVGVDPGDRPGVALQPVVQLFARVEARDRHRAGRLAGIVHQCAADHQMAALAIARRARQVLVPQLRPLALQAQVLRVAHPHDHEVIHRALSFPLFPSGPPAW